MLSQFGWACTAAETPRTPGTPPRPPRAQVADDDTVVDVAVPGGAGRQAQVVLAARLDKRRVGNVDRVGLRRGGGRGACVGTGAQQANCPGRVCARLQSWVAMHGAGTTWVERQETWLGLASTPDIGERGEQCIWQGWQGCMPRGLQQEHPRNVEVQAAGACSDWSC